MSATDQLDAAGTRLVLAVDLDGNRYYVEDYDGCEDLQTLLLLKSERAADRGDEFDRDYYRYQASQVGCLFSALKEGLMLPQPQQEI